MKILEYNHQFEVEVDRQKVHSNDRARVVKSIKWTFSNLKTKKSSLITSARTKKSTLMIEHP